MVLVETKIKIEDKLLKAIEKRAKKENITKNEVINNIIENEVGTTRGIPNYLLANRDTYNPDPERSKKMIGIIKTKEPIDAVKLVREIREGR